MTAVQGTREALTADLHECETKISFHKKELERLEKEKEVLEGKIKRLESSFPRKPQLAQLNAAINASLERQEEDSEEFQRLYQERKRILLPDPATGDASLCPLSSRIWERLSGEDRRQRGYVLAALTEDICLREVGLSGESFNEKYPELVDDREIVMARVKNSYFSFERNLIPTHFANDEEVIFAAFTTDESFLRSTPDHLMSSTSFLKKVISYTFAEDIDETNRRPIIPHEQLFRILIDREASLSTIRENPDLVFPMTNMNVIWDSDVLIEDLDLVRFFDEIFGSDSWPPCVVHKWVRDGREFLPWHESFRNNDRELALLLLDMDIERFESFVSDDLRNDKRFVIEALEVGPWPTIVVPEWMQWDFDVLVSTLNCNHSFKLGNQQDPFAFNQRLYQFGLELRELVGRRDVFRVFLDSSQNLASLGLDNETTDFLIKTISSFLGPPEVEEMPRLCGALAEIEKCGYP